MALTPLPSGEAKRAAVQTMFERIAPRYDLLNRIISLGLDQRWRTRALDAIRVGHGDRVIDLACGTGDLARLAAARGASVVGVDFAHGMLRRAAQREAGLRWVRADAARIPLEDGWASAVVCGFALRNFVAIPTVLAETARVLTPGGRVAFLDIGRPERSWMRAANRLYFERVVPRIGAWLSDREAYAYLPRSVEYLPPDPELLAWLAKAGFETLRCERLLLGMTRLFLGVRA